MIALALSIWLVWKGNSMAGAPSGVDPGESLIARCWEARDRRRPAPPGGRPVDRSIGALGPRARLPDGAGRRAPRGARTDHETFRGFDLPRGGVLMRLLFIPRCRPVDSSSSSRSSRLTSRGFDNFARQQLAADLISEETFQHRGISFTGTTLLARRSKIVARSWTIWGVYRSNKRE